MTTYEETEMLRDELAQLILGGYQLKPGEVTLQMMVETTGKSSEVIRKKLQEEVRAGRLEVFRARVDRSPVNVYRRPAASLETRTQT